jgi:hypothetical protein
MNSKSRIEQDRAVNRARYWSWKTKNPENRSRWRARPEKQVEYVLAYQKQYPERSRAKQRLYNAVKSGKIVRSPFCQLCWCVAKLDGHHQDYSRPLDVIWLCRQCHIWADKWQGEK